ncbi:MAG: sigma-70 family RNA polymerase sigma factor [Vicinamibacteria bacterium]|nr:sigma-70 family RNA polymerase sigma factor [Vicinamibacteria bacterium]
MRRALVCCMLMAVMATAVYPSMEHDDALDVDHARQGDETAFEALVVRHESHVYRLARRMLGDPDEALDATQETFLRVFRGIGSFRGDARFRTWVIGIALNVCRSRLTSAARRERLKSVCLEHENPETGERRDYPIPDPSPDPEAMAMGEELRIALDRALASLSVEHRTILLLREMQDLDYENLARALACPVGTVKSRLCRAREALRKAMEEIWP